MSLGKNITLYQLVSKYISVRFRFIDLVDRHVSRHCLDLFSSKYRKYISWPKKYYDLSNYVNKKSRRSPCVRDS